VDIKGAHVGENYKRYVEGFALAARPRPRDLADLPISAIRRACVVFLHQIAVGKLDPYRPPWVFHQALSEASSQSVSFPRRLCQIGKRKVDGGPIWAESDERLFSAISVRPSGSSTSGASYRPRRGFLRRVRLTPARFPSTPPDHRVEIEVRGQWSEAEGALIERPRRPPEKRPVTVQRTSPSLRRGARP